MSWRSTSKLNRCIYCASDDTVLLLKQIEAVLRSYLTANVLEHSLQEGALVSGVHGHKQIYVQGAAAYAH